VASEQVVIVNDGNFSKEVLEADIPVLVDFWAEWCGPCRMVAPILDKLAGEFQGRLKVTKLNVDENRQTAGKYGIMSIPTLIIFKNGEIKDKIMGALPEAKLRQRVEESL
jgi:thioredoxin 1